MTINKIFLWAEAGVKFHYLWYNGFKHKSVWIGAMFACSLDREKLMILLLAQALKFQTYNLI